MGLFNFFKSKKTGINRSNKEKDISNKKRIYVEDIDIDTEIDVIEYENTVVKYKGSPFTGIIYNLIDEDGEIFLWVEIDMKDGRKHGQLRNYLYGKLYWSQEYLNGEQVLNEEIGGRTFHLSDDEVNELEKTKNSKPKINSNNTSKKKIDSIIYKQKELNDLIDNKGYIHNNITINGEEIVKLKGIKKIYGNLNIICNNNLQNLGHLNYIKKDLWGRDSGLLCLGDLEKVGGNIDLNGSKIKSLNKLSRVGGKLNLRDTKIEDFGDLKYVGKDLYLPKRLKSFDLDNIEVKGKIKYWNDKNTSKISKVNKEIDFFVTNFSDIHQSELKIKKRFLTGKKLVLRCYDISKLNDFIINNINEFFVFVDKELENLYENNYSFYKVLFDEIKTVNEINQEFPKVKFKKRKDQYIFNDKLFYEDLKLIKKESDEIIKSNSQTNPCHKYLQKLKDFESICDEEYGYKPKSWVRYDEHKLGFCESTGKTKNSFIYFVEDILDQIFTFYVFNLQNEFRVSKGIPKIGEGWVSETELYHLLKEYFDKETIIHHGKPKWLGRQHVDIWFPEHKLGIEYQGLQHDQPVEFFGGEEGFLKGKERDEKKKRLFKENNSTLIEVRKGYDLQEVIDEIQKYILVG